MSFKDLCIPSFYMHSPSVVYGSVDDRACYLLQFTLYIG